MAYQIYAVSNCFTQHSTYYVRTHCIDTRTKQLSQKVFPITKVPKLAIGSQYRDDKTIINRLSNAELLNVRFEEFNSGKIVSLSQLPSISASFNPDKESLIKAKYYLINETNLTYAFPCYELFRTFLGMDNRFFNLLFQYDALESFIDNDYGGIKTTLKGSELQLDLNKSFPKSLLGKKTIKKFVLILYNPAIRALWKSIQAQLMGGESDFSFSTIKMKNINLRFIAKRVGDIQLVHSISSILSKIPFPAESITINHPLLNSRNEQKDKTNKGGERNKKSSFKVPLSEDNRESGNSSNDNFEEVTILKLEYEFDKEITIHLNKLNNETSAEDGKTNPFAIPSLTERSLSLNQDKNSKGDNFMALTRDNVSNKFDQAEIPIGLVFFTKVVELVTSKLSINFNYNVFEFEEDYSFHMLANEKRHGIIVELENPDPIYIIEVDSSDDKYISTLLLTNLRTKNKDDLFDIILSKLSKSQGAWPKDTLELYSDYKIIRHPRRGNEVTKQAIGESDDTNLYIKRFSNRIIRTLT